MQRSPERWPGWVTTATLALVVLTRHRSVWVATIVMLVAVVFAVRGLSDRRLAMAVGAVATAALLGLGSQPLLGEVGDTLATSAVDTRTWGWRQERWGLMWDEHTDRGAVPLLMGAEYGNPWLSSAGDGRGVSPHNFHVRIAIRLGLVGTVVLFGTYLWLIRHQLRVASSPSPGQLLAILLLGHLVYYIPYGTTPVLGLLLAAIAWDRPSGLIARAETGSDSHARRRSGHT